MENKTRVAEDLDNLQFEENNVLLLNTVSMPNEGEALLTLQGATLLWKI